MMKKKYLIAVFCLLAVLATASTATAQKSKTVILVSDNEADSAVAEAIENVKNIEVVTTPWGEFDENVVDQIKALEPNTIFIIGGPVAVPSGYETALSDYNVIRFSGEDRYDTSAKALEHFNNDFKGKGIVAVYGHDKKGIKKALKKAKGVGWFVLFVKSDDVPDSIKTAIENSNITDVNFLQSPNSNIAKILNQLGKTKKGVKYTAMNESEKESRAIEQILDAQTAINEAVAAIGDCERGAAVKLLEQASKHMINAGNLLADGESGKAFGQAISAEHLAKNAERFAKRHLCLGGTGPDGKDKDHDDEEKFCGEIETLTCPNGETGQLKLVGGQTFNLTDETEYEDGINSCDDLNISDIIKVEAKNESGTLYAKEIELEDHCEGGDDGTTTTTSTASTTSTTTTSTTTTTTVEPTTTTSSTTSTTVEPTTTTTTTSPV